jgi:acyl-coenzyme A synthetase/AMP-(fatty) acid ligase
LTAYVTRSGQPLSSEALWAWCRERIASFKRPRTYAFIDDVQMPRTATGKIQDRGCATACRPRRRSASDAGVPRGQP